MVLALRDAEQRPSQWDALRAARRRLARPCGERCSFDHEGPHADFPASGAAHAGGVGLARLRQSEGRRGAPHGHPAGRDRSWCASRVSRAWQRRMEPGEPRGGVWPERRAGDVASGSRAAAAKGVAPVRGGSSRRRPRRDAAGASVRPGRRPGRRGWRHLGDTRAAVARASRRRCFAARRRERRVGGLGRPVNATEGSRRGKARCCCRRRGGARRCGNPAGAVARCRRDAAAAHSASRGSNGVPLAGAARAADA